MLNMLLPRVGELMMDSFANYLIQKLNKLALPQQIEQIFINVRDFSYKFVRYDPCLWCWRTTNMEHGPCKTYSNTSSL